MKKIFSFFAAMLFAVAANATVWHVSPTSSDAEGEHSTCNIFRTLKAEHAQAGDTVLLADGSYDETQSIYLNNSVVIMAEEGAHPVIMQVSYFKLLASAKFIGIKFQHNAESNGYCMYFQSGCTKLELENCEITNFKETCIMSWDQFALDELIINNCYIHDNVKSAIYDPSGYIANTVITNSTFANNDVSPWSAGLIDIRKGASGDPKLTVDHCTFYHNLLTNSDYGEIRPRGLTGVLVSNCIFAQPEDYERVATRFSDNNGNGEVRNVITHHYTKRTNQWGHYDGATYTACSMGDPLFVDAANANFTLGEGSPALNYAGKDENGADVVVNLGDPRWVPAAAPAHTYTVAGSNADLFGTTWAPANTANDMTLQTDGTYKWEKAEITLAAGSIEFKVCQDHDWNPAYPSQNYVLNITEAGIYTITITFDPSNNSVNAVATKTGSAEVLPTVAMHGNFLGSWADTQNFTEADDKATASLKLTLAAGNYEFGMRIGGSGNWTANGTAFTRQNNSAEVVSGQGNLTLAADAAGEYTFTWTYATNNLAITFPEAAPVAKFKIAGSMSDSWAPSIESFEDSYTFENLAAGNHKFKVVDGSDWLGFSALTEADRADELYTDQDGNVCFTLAQAGEVVVTYIKDQVFKVEGDFVLPTVQLIGIGGWDADENAITLTAAQDKKSASVTLNLDGWYYEFKMIVGGAWLGKENAEGLYGLHREWTSVDGLTYAGGNIKLTMDAQDIVPGDYTFTWEYVAGKLTVTFPTPAPTGITWELNGGAVLPKGCDTNEELWEAFKPDYNAFYSVARADQPIDKVSTFVQDNPGSKSMMMSETSGWKWLGDYLIASCADQGDESWDLSAGTDQQWRMTLHSFFNKEDKTNWPMGSSHALFSEAGKEEHWLAAYAEMVLPESVSAEYTLPAAYKADAEFGGWYDNAEFSGDALTVIPANYAGTLYAKWNSPATNIENTAVDAKVVKLIENGKLIIIRNGVRYNAQGQME